MGVPNTFLYKNIHNSWFANIFKKCFCGKLYFVTNCRKVISEPPSCKSYNVYSPFSIQFLNPISFLLRYKIIIPQNWWKYWSCYCLLQKRMSLIPNLHGVSEKGVKSVFKCFELRWIYIQYMSIMRAVIHPFQYQSRLDYLFSKNKTWLFAAVLPSNRIEYLAIEAPSIIWQVNERQTKTRMFIVPYKPSKGFLRVEKKRRYWKYHRHKIDWKKYKTFW